MEVETSNSNETVESELKLIKNGDSKSSVASGAMNRNVDGGVPSDDKTEPPPTESQIVETQNESTPVQVSSEAQDVIPIPRIPPEEHEEDFTIFHCVSYLGASTIHEPRSEQEIHRVMGFLNEQPIDKLIEVSVSVPLYSDGNVM